MNEADARHDGMRGASFWRNLDFAVYLLTIILAAFAVRRFLLEPIRVDGASMVPTLVHGEHMLVEKCSYWVEEPQRGQIIICFYPGYTESCVKRVVGLPGETVAVTGGRVLINGVALDESSYFGDGIWSDMEPVTVPDKSLFVMGDNRNGSKDSRDSSVGSIPYYKVVGRVRAVIWPLSVFKTIPEESY